MFYFYYFIFLRVIPRVDAGWLNLAEARGWRIEFYRDSTVFFFFLSLCLLIPYSIYSATTFSFAFYHFFLFVNFQWQLSVACCHLNIEFGVLYSLLETCVVFVRSCLDLVLILFFFLQWLCGCCLRLICLNKISSLYINQYFQKALIYIDRTCQRKTLDILFNSVNGTQKKKNRFLL